MKINIRGVDKADVLAALYNRAHGSPAGGFSYMQKDMTTQEAKLLLERQKSLRFDYVKGRPLKVDLSEDIIDVTSYDRDNGGYAARRALSHLTLPSNQPVEEIKKQGWWEVLQYIFKTHIQVVAGYPADSYGDNLRALQYADQACGVDQKFLKQFLDHEYSEQGGGLFGLSFIHRYSQRNNIRDSRPMAGLEILYACFSFINDKNESLLSELLSMEESYFYPSSEKIARALVGDLNYIRDSQWHFSREGKQPSLVNNFLQDKNKAPIILSAILRGESAPIALRLILNNITSDKTLDNNVVYSSLQLLQEKISKVSNKPIRLELSNILDESIRKHPYYNLLFAMEKAIKKVNSSWNSNNKKEKTEILGNLRFNFFKNPSQENYQAFITEAAKPRKSWIGQAQEGKTASLFAFNSALSEQTKQTYEENIDHSIRVVSPHK